jgi:uncharacterized repeat protein (TIGR01451 family)
MPKEKSSKKLSSLPGVGKTRAKALENAGLKTIEDVAAARREDLAKINNMGPALAEKLIKSAKEALIAPKDSEETESRWLSEKNSLFICPACGSLASSGAVNCPKCDARFEEDDEVELALEAELDEIEDKATDGFWYKDEAKLFLCPSCGSLAAAGSKKCPSCDVEFEQEDKLVDIPLVRTEESKEEEKDGFWYRDDAKLFLCPSCGSLAAAGSKSCPRCGAQFVEDDAVEMPLELEMAQPAEGSEAKRDADVDGHWYKDGASLFLCPGCGSLAASGSKKCPNCGAEFVEDESIELPLMEKTDDGADAGKDVDGFWYKDKKSLFICPGCGSLATEGAEKCSHCGAVFAADTGVEMPLVEMAPEEKLEEPVELYLCPDCGAFLSEKASRCQACGADFGAPEITIPPAEKPPAEPPSPKCPACGKDVASLGARCPSCQPTGKTCKTCGESYEGDGDFCTVCGALEFAIGMDIPSNIPLDEPSRDRSPPVEVLENKEKQQICELCGKQVREGESLCLDCRIGKLTAKLDGKAPDSQKMESATKRRGISKDFIQRWSGMGAPVPDAPAQVKPASVKSALKTAPDVARPEPKRAEAKTADDWFQRGVSLMAAGELDEAMRCFDRAAEMSPDRETDYRARALELIARMRDVSGGADEDQMSRDIENLDARFWFIEESLKNNPKDDRLWQERGELLQKRGQSAEATRSFQEAIRLSYERIIELAGPATAPVASGRQPNSPSSGMTNGLRGKPVGGMANARGRTNGRVNGLVNGRGRTNGLVNGRGRTNGRANGLVNGRVRTIGRTNGLVNGRGRTNGRINGLVNGRGKTNGRIDGLVNGRGITNGRTNGLVNGRGKVNGLVNGLGYTGGITNGQGLVNGAGLVNGVGLINGTGFVDGTAPASHRNRHEQRNQWHWMSALLALAVALMMFSPMLDLGRQRGATLSVDGNFEDWEKVIGYRNTLAPDTANPDIAIDTIKLGYENQKLFVYASVRGRALAGQYTPGLNSTASIYAFIDGDRNPNTGYSVGSMGADYLLEISGWRGDRESAVLKTFDPSKNRTNWLGFDSGAAASAAVSNSEIEAEAFLPPNVTAPLILVCTSDGSGYMDAAESPVSPGLAVLKAFERGPSSDSLSEPGILEVQRIILHSSGGAASISGLVLARIGLAPGAVSVSSIVATRASGAGEALAFTASDGGPTLNLTFATPLAVGADEVVNLTIAGSAGQGAVLPNTTGLSLRNVLRAEAGDVHISKRAPSTISIGIWTEIRIDGAFADWNGVPKSPDSLGDVATSLGNGLLANGNVDLVSSAMLDGGEFYVQVSGTVLGGSVFPAYSIRGSPTPTPDWNNSDDDRDGVPNGQDPMPNDFNNDGIDDSQANGDKDGDGIVDYPNGPDMWINATTPGNFPGPYANRTTEVYVGPVTEREMLGEDSLVLWIDSDGDASTGAPVPGGLGADNALVVTGRAGIVTGTALAAYDPGQGTIPWRETGIQVLVGNDIRRLEGRLPGWLVGPQTLVAVELRDSDGSSDVSDSSLSPSAVAASTRSPLGNNVVINEIVSQPSNGEWIELCNPTTAAINIGGWRIRHGGSTLLTFPVNTILGAFGSGTEYYIVNLMGGTNDLPNGGDIIRLQRSITGTWTTQDQTTYPAITAGQSWARFKNVTFGMPTDTDSDANDFYISASPSFSAPNDRRAPAIVVAKSGDRAIATPGDLVTYTIYYNNTGDGNARHVWVNDTLPAGTTYVSSSVPYASFAGQTYRWYFNHVAPGDHSFTVTVRVSAGVPLGTILSNVAWLSYTDQLSRPMDTSADWFNVTVQVPPPTINVVKRVANSAPFAGEQVTFYIYYNNTGIGSAADVWLNDTLPAGMAYVSASQAPDSVSGQIVRWHFTGIAPGNYQLELVVVVGAGVAVGTVLTNNIMCEYEDLAGFAMPPSISAASATVDDPVTSIVINEVYVRPSNLEWIELCNPSAIAINIGGWRVRVGTTTLYTFPAGTTIGAWGSGSEYLIVDLSATTNQLPDGGGTVRLQRLNGFIWQTIDQTTYPAFGVDGRSWARFKHEDTGKPVDTNNDVNDFYVSNNGWIIPERATRGTPNERRRPVMSVVKRADVSEAEPGDTITYTIWYNNTGDGNAKRVWVNDTLPLGTIYLFASPTPASISGQVVSWYFPTVQHNTVNSITLRAIVYEDEGDGVVLTNMVTLRYRDQLFRAMISSTSYSNITVRRPVIVVEKVANVADVQAGGFITYTIFYNNTGSRTAANIWINDTLPQWVVFQSSSVAPSSSNGLTYGWHFPAVAPGPHSFTITVLVNATAPSGIIENFARLNYTSSAGRHLVGSESAASVVIPEFGSAAVPILFVILAAMIIRRRERKA